jgi:hypothetical protein
MLMGQGLDQVAGGRASLEVEPFFGGVRYKKREAIAPLFVSLFGTECTLQRVCFQCLIVLIIGCPIILSGDVLFNLQIVSESVGHGSVVVN